MIEKLATEIHEVQKRLSLDEKIPFAELNDVDRLRYTAMARAVLQALREPTPEMVAAHDAEYEMYGHEDMVGARRSWQAMIDAASK